VRVRKGTVGAFTRNLDMLKEHDLAPEEREQHLAVLRELAVGMAALGFNEHFQCRDPAIQAIMDEAEQRLGA